MNTIRAEVLGRIKAFHDLPSPSETARRIVQLTQMEEVSPLEIEQAIRADPAFVARLIRMSNSVTAGEGGRPVVAIKDALMVLDLPTIRGLALGFSLFDNFRKESCPHFDFQMFWSRSLATALSFQGIAEQTRIAPVDEALSVGLLAHIGELALAAVFPREYGRILAEAAKDRFSSLCDRQRERFGFDQWELSAELMSGWGIPGVYVDTVRLQQGLAHERPAIGTRSYQLAHSLGLGVAIAEILLRPARRTRQNLFELFHLGARVSLEPAEIIAIGKRVVKEWDSWADNFKLPKGCAFDLSWMEQAVAEPRLLSQDFPRQELSLRILLVDGERESRSALSRDLRDAGYALTEAGDSEQALTSVAENAPDIVIVERALPAMDGVELIRRLRQMPAGNSLYILAITSDTDENDLMGVFDAGIDDVTLKPVKLRVLRARLKAAERVIRMQREAEKHFVEMRNVAAELSASNRRLLEISIADALTGCPNRRYAMDRLKQEWSAAERRATPLSCLVIDVDKFKQINDRLGNDQGDEVLKSIAAVLRAGVRVQDVVCRVGGDEFWVICPDADKTAVTACAERLCGAVKKIETQDSRIKCSISIGVAERLPGMVGPDALIEQADRHLCQAKQGGRGRVVGNGSESAAGAKTKQRQSKKAKT